jgi:membrane-associated phospholipid phosphatase
MGPTGTDPIPAPVERGRSRARPKLPPDRGLHAVEPLAPGEGPWCSFPSGHTAGAVAVALARVRRAAHCPGGVLAGALVGAAAQALAGRLLPPP